MASLQEKTEKLTMVGMKFSLMMMERICFQSVVLSPSSRQMDSSASFTAAGGLAIERTSTRCCFFIDFTANQSQILGISATLFSSMLRANTVIRQHQLRPHQNTFP
uniref:Uncharacterized protein n=1 Tax=Anser cygnoides TaxID=8845 RepID=A0A8B9DVE6_ANSCY